MTSLVSLDVAKEHLRVLHDDDDDDITLKIEQASEIILDYIKRRGPGVTDDSPQSDWNVDNVPAPLQAAVLLKLSDLYDNRNAGVGSDEYVAMGYLSQAITSLCHRFRDPAMA